jgi:hypothetical protein
MSAIKYVLLLLFGLSLRSPAILIYAFILYLLMLYAPILGVVIVLYSLFKLIKMLIDKRKQDD